METNQCKCQGTYKEILEKYSKDKSNLIKILNDIQEKSGYIPMKAQKEISEYLNMPMAEIYGVKHLPSDFKKKNGYKRSIELSEQYHLYRQDFCGCKYSKAEEEIRKQKMKD